MIRIILLSLTMTLGACATHSPPNSVDPYVKLRQAVQFKSQGDLASSERITKEVISVFLEQGNIFGQSEALFFLGDLYKGQIEWGNSYINGNLDKSLFQFKLSKKGFESIDENIQASRSALEISTLLWAKGDKLGSCSTVKEALKLYKSGEGKHKDFIISIPSYKTAGNLIQSNIDRFCIKIADRL